MNTALVLDAVHLSIAGQVLFQDFSLRIERGEIVTLMGPSGCGKSTLLAYLCGTLANTIQAQGQIYLGANELSHRPPEQRRIGILFQDDLLFPHLSVGDNLAFGLSPQIRTRAERRQRINAALQDAELEGFSDRDPATLSGGQRARIALMRTLLAAPQALLLDEPFAKLDSGTKARFRDFVFAHARAEQLPTLLVTHDPADAAAAGGRVIEL
jgi:putative thiamine transport system ATP-binding protein